LIASTIFPPHRVTIVGALNVTPDSFSDGGRFMREGTTADVEAAALAAAALVRSGAHVIDIGGESTRPGAEATSVEVELARTVRVVEAVAKRVDVPISIDTRKACVAEAALAAGARVEGGVIKTFVTFAVERVLKGPDQTEVTLEFLGGTVGEETMTVSGMPKFNLGAREIVFVQKNGVQFCPLVALMHGRYRVLRDEATAREHIARDNGLPLTNVAEVELPITTLPGPVRAASAASASTRALTPEAFEASITSEVQRPTPRLRTN
jgi:hypothetical protein